MLFRWFLTFFLEKQEGQAPTEDQLSKENRVQLV